MKKLIVLLLTNLSIFADRPVKMISIENKPNEWLSNAKRATSSESLEIADIERTEKGKSRSYLLPQTHKYSR